MDYKTYLILIHNQIFWLDSPEDQVHDIQDDHIVVVEIGLIGAAR